MPSADLDVIAIKLDQMASNQKDTDKKVDILTERMLDPENGLFARVRSNEIYTQRNEEYINELTESVDKLLSVCETHDKSVITIENWVKSHDERDNDLRQTVNKLAESVQSHSKSIDQKFEKSEKELLPMKEDFTVRQSNQKWKDKIYWLLISALIMAVIVPPIVSLIQGNFSPKESVEIKEPKRLKEKDKK